MKAIDYIMDSRINDIVVSDVYKASGIIQRQKISFKIRDTIPAIANYIRRAVKSGLLGVKILTCEIEDIESNDDFLLRIELRNYRIRHIPILQDTPDDTIFSIDVSNDTDNYHLVTSNDIQCNIKKPFMINLPILMLSPRSYLRVNNIHITTGIGYDNDPAFSVCDGYEYNVIDYIPVNYLDKVGTMIIKFIHYADVATNTDELIGKKILIIDPEYKEDLESYEAECYDIIIMEPITFYTSYGANIRELMLSFTTFGTIDARELIIKSCHAIRDVIKELRSAIRDNDITKINITKGKIYSVKAKGMNIMLAELVLQYIGLTEPTITVNYTDTIHSNTEFCGNIFNILFNSFFIIRKIR